MSDRASALRADFKPGVYGDLSQGTGVTLTETFHDFVAEIAAFDSHIDDVAKLIRRAEARIEGSIAFQIAANRLLTAGPSKFRAALENGIDGRQGSFIDLSHGRSCFGVQGPKAEWVLSKLFAVDFRERAFLQKSGLTTMHHDTFAQIYRSCADSFEIFVFRSFARSFWHTLRRAAEETGYEVV